MNAQPMETLRLEIIPRVIGVVKDFHYRSLREEIQPLLLRYHSGQQYLSLRIGSKDCGHLMFLHATSNGISFLRIEKLNLKRPIVSSRGPLVV